MKSIGVDVGGSKISACVVTHKGKVLKNVIVPTPSKKGKDAIIKAICDAITRLNESCAAGVGIALPGFVDKKGKVIFAGGTLTSLVGTNIKKRIEKKVLLPTHIENDANCFTFAEALFGAAKKQEIVLGIIWGTGIGSGIVVKKSILAGSKGGAGELGQISLYHDNKKNPCTTIEELCSGKNILRRYRRLGGTTVYKTATDLLKKKRDVVARQVADDAILNLAKMIAILTHVHNPSVIVLGGGLANAPQEVYKKIASYARKFTHPVYRKSLKLKKFSLRDDAGAIGAAQLVFTKQTPNK
jgi:glucokinase